MLKILQARPQQYVNCEFPDVQAGFSEGRGTRDQIVNIRWIIEKAREFSKTSTSALLTTPRSLSGNGPHLAWRAKPPGFSRVACPWG